RSERPTIPTSRFRDAVVENSPRWVAALAEGHVIFLVLREPVDSGLVFLRVHHPLLLGVDVGKEVAGPFGRDTHRLPFGLADVFTDRGDSFGGWCAHLTKTS